LNFACTPALTEAEVDLSECECEVTSLTVDIADLIGAASDALYVLTGGLASGLCSFTVRPCWDGPWCVCGRGRGCRSCAIPGIPLKGIRPVVTQVKIDGVVVPATDYVLIDGYKLVRVDGTGWPASKNALLPDTEDDTFSVTITHGLDWDFLAKMAANELVCEMVLVLTGSETRLPKGAVSYTADGVQIVVGRLPGQEEIQAVGLTWLGKFLALYGNAVMSQLLSPELREGWTLHHVEFYPVVP
jgi:hypothetical protein